MIVSMLVVNRLDLIILFCLRSCFLDALDRRYEVSNHLVLNENNEVEIGFLCKQHTQWTRKWFFALPTNHSFLKRRCISSSSLPKKNIVCQILVEFNYLMFGCKQILVLVLILWSLLLSTKRFSSLLSMKEMKASAFSRGLGSHLVGLLCGCFLPNTVLLSVCKVTTKQIDCIRLIDSVELVPNFFGQFSEGFTFFWEMLWQHFEN